MQGCFIFSYLLSFFMCKTLFRSQGLLLDQLGYCFMWTAGSLLTWSNMNISANYCLVFERLFETILFQKHLSWRHNQALLFSSCPPLESSGNECCLPHQLLQCSPWAGRVPWMAASEYTTDWHRKLSSHNPGVLALIHHHLLSLSSFSYHMVSYIQILDIQLNFPAKLQNKALPWNPTLSEFF